MTSQFYARYIPPTPSPSLAISKEDQSSKLKRKLGDLKSPKAPLHGEVPSTNLKKRRHNREFGSAAIDGALDARNVDDVISTRETSRVVKQGKSEDISSKESTEVKKHKPRKAGRALDNSTGRSKGVGGKAEINQKAKKGQNLGSGETEDNDTLGITDYAQPNDIIGGDQQAKRRDVKEKKKDIDEYGDEGDGHADSGWHIEQRLAENKPKERRVSENLDGGEKMKQKSKAREGDLSSESTESDEDMEGDAKYKSILSKFQRSAQIAEMLAKEPPSETDGDLQNHERVELQGLVPLPQPEEVPDSKSRLAFSALPSWLEHPIAVSSNATTPFRDLQLNARLVSSLESKGYRNAFAIQSQVLPMLLPGPTQHVGDLCISAATGSGKTLAYVLPMIENLRNKTFTRLRGLIVVPTRELVTQTKEVCDLCSAGSSLNVGLAVGNRPLKVERGLLIRRGQKYDPLAYKEMQEMSTDAGNGSNYDLYGDSDSEGDFVTLPEHVATYTSKVDILISTPGRLVDHIRSTPGFTLEDLQWLIIDEADRLLDQSFQEWVDVVLRAVENTKEYGQMKAHEQILIDMGFRLPKNNTRKIVLSATMTRDIGKLSALKLRMPKLIVVDNHGSTKPKSSAKEGGEKGDESQGETEQVDAFGLPSTLKEWAIAAGDGSEKPLYLLQLLQTKILLNRDGNDANASTVSKDVSLSEDQSETTSSEDCTSDDERESISRHASSSPSSTSARGLGSADDSPSGLSSLSAQLKASPSIGCDRNCGILIFTKSNESAIRLSRLLSLLHTPLASCIGTLTGSIPSSARRKMLAAFRANKLPILIASDLVARGLDVKNITHIVNYDLPKGVKGYVHRVGRTARAGRKGEAWSLVTEKEARWFWKEIGGGASVRRSEDQRVVRVKLDINALGSEGRKGYEEALKTLMSEVKGGTPGE